MQVLNLLNFEFIPNPKNPNAKVLTFLHGLFGNLHSLDTISRAFEEDYSILKLDLRNHGKSFQRPIMNYSSLAGDVIAVLEHLKIEQTILIGHSMGGKIAMTIANKCPDLVEKLVVLDIAPVAYNQNRQRSVFASLLAVQSAKPSNRAEALKIMDNFSMDLLLKQFLLKAFDPNNKDCFPFNVSFLSQQYPHLMDWNPVRFTKPALFIKGAKSDYILWNYRSEIVKQFPNSKGLIVNGAEHWVHYQKPNSVIRAIKNFLD